MKILSIFRDHPAFICMSLLMVSVILTSHSLYVNKKLTFATPDAYMPSVLQNQTIRIVELARENLVIRGKTFENCDIYGPAVIFQENCIFDNLTMDASRESATIETSNTMASGAIKLDTCAIRNCRFYKIGFIGSKEQLASIRAKMSEKK